jgi:hypothetical protein
MGATVSAHLSMFHTSYKPTLPIIKLCAFSR